jgi:transcriptional regulator with XRE-family HTH domain
MNNSLSRFSTVPEIMKHLATRLRDLRLQNGLKQTTLANKSSVTLASLRRFEATGQISLENLLKLSMALGRLNEFRQLFETTNVTSIDQLETIHNGKTPKRGKR